MTSLHWRVCRAERNYSNGDIVFKIKKAKKSEILIQFIHCVFTFMASLWSLAYPTYILAYKKWRRAKICFMFPTAYSEIYFLSHIVLEFGSYVTSKPHTIYMQTNHAGRVSFKLDEKQ